MAGACKTDRTQDTLSSICHTAGNKNKENDVKLKDRASFFLHKAVGTIFIDDDISVVRAELLYLPV